MVFVVNSETKKEKDVQDSKIFLSELKLIKYINKIYFKYLNPINLYRIPRSKNAFNTS